MSTRPAGLSAGWLSWLAVVVCAALAGVLVARGWGWVVVALVALGGLLALTPEYKIAVAFLLVYFPFSPGSAGPIPNILFAEIIVPVAFPFVLLATARAGRPLLPAGTRRYGIAAVVVLGVAGMQFLTGPLANSLSGQVQFGSTGLRPFYDLVAYILLFFMAVWILDWLPKTTPAWRKFLGVLLVGSVAVAILRLTTVLLAVDTPLMVGVFDYGGQTRLPNGVPVLRIGGLAEAATLGLACLGALWTMRLVKPATALVALIWLLACVGLSGGRSLAIGVAVAVFAYLLGPARGRRLRIIIGGAITLLIVLGLAIQYGFITQLSRILALEGGIVQQDPARAEVFRVLWESFLANPLFGKGIGVATAGLSDAFVAAQVVAGGHSSYMSMLGNFGLVGAYFLWVFLFDPIVRSLLRTRRAPTEDLHSLTQGLMTFVLIHAVIKAVEYVAGGSGYRDPSMYLVTALFVVAWGMEVRNRAEAT